MRLWLPAVVLLLFAAAGCVTPESETDPLLGVCPQWRAGPWTESVDITLEEDGTTARSVHTPNEDGDAALHLGSWPVDRYRIQFDAFEAQGAILRLHAYGNDTAALAIYDFREPRVQVLPSLALGPSTAAIDHIFEVTLSPVEHGSAAAPAPLRLEWRLEPNGNTPSATATVTVTALYKVCGAPL